MPHIGPRTAAADSLHAMKYRGPGEDFREAMNRVAFGLKDSDAHYMQFRDIILHQRFLPAGRVQSAIGSPKAVTALNCYVSGPIADSFVHGEGCIMDRAKEAAATMRMGGGIGYDFSTLRPRGDNIRKLASQSTGPVSFMAIFDAVCRATSSSGHRRGAQMGVLRVDHPDIVEFINAKQNTNNLTGFNISIAVTDEFMEAALNGKEFDLRWNGQVYSTIDAASLWNSIMRSTWDWAEPGVLFIDRINEMNNLWYCENIAATNPCAEQPLPPFGACLLGSFNLVQYLEPAPTPRPVGAPAWDFNWTQFNEDIPAVVRAMDNVTDRSKYPLPMQKAEAQNKRRMGLGYTGLANAAEALGYVYGSSEFLLFTSGITKTLAEQAYHASMKLAVEKGAFHLFDEEKYPQSKFVQKLPLELQKDIAKYGIRNSHLTSIAPTGTISMTADNVSSGLEPVFSYSTQRMVQTPNGPVLTTIDDYGAGFLGVKGKTADEVTVEEHVAVLRTTQNYVDSSVSKTINMDSAVMSWSEFEQVYRACWEGGAKGCSTFNKSGKRMALLTAAPKDDKEEEVEGESCVILENGQRSCG